MKRESSLLWKTFRRFLLLTLALAGGFALIDQYFNGQNITKYLLYGAFIGALMACVSYERE